MFVLKLNGHEHKIDADADMPLLWVLCDALDLTGTKFGCGAGLCGAGACVCCRSTFRECLIYSVRPSTSSGLTIPGGNPGGTNGGINQTFPEALVIDRCARLSIAHLVKSDTLYEARIDMELLLIGQP